MVCGDQCYGEGMRGKDMVGMVSMADVFKEEDGEEKTKEQCQSAKPVFCEQGQVKNAVYEEHVEGNEAEHVLVELVCVLGGGRGHVLGREEEKEEGG